MSPETPMFARLTHGAKRINLGRAPINVLMIRAMEEMKKIRKADEMVLQLEFGTSKLMDSTTFDRAAIQEQEFAQNLVTDRDAESPFPGITIGRVADVMMTPEYTAYEAICEPEKRMGLSQPDIDRITQEYHAIAKDCFPHFPKWIP